MKIMWCFKRRKCIVILLLVVCFMFSFNILFVVDLTLYHQTPRESIEEGIKVVGPRDSDMVEQDLSRPEFQHHESEIDGFQPDKERLLEDSHDHPDKNDRPDNEKFDTEKPPEDLKGIRRKRRRRRRRVPVFTVEVLSSKSEVEIRARNRTLYHVKEKRGIHVVVLHQRTAAMMASRVFDTYMPGAEDDLVSFLNSISKNRVLCLGILDEGTFSLKSNGRDALDAIGSFLAYKLSWRDMWALVTVKGGTPLVEDIEKSPDVKSWGLPLFVAVDVPIARVGKECDWPKTPENFRRLEFCRKYEGYGSLCHCSKPLPLYTHPTYRVEPNHIANVPVAVIASNRPAYLFRMLRRLLSTPGSNPRNTVVFIDGFFPEVVGVAELVGVRAVQHEPKSKKNGRISQHYKSSLTTIFNLYPSADYAIIIEEDLDVAVDFFSYFSQTKFLLEEDDSVYCVSAWNDQGYRHTIHDPALLYRVETMPGLGWLLKKKMFKEELESQWPSPDKLWDWDMWMRLDGIRKGRECIIPDVSRTFHFGASGLNMNPYFHEHYFKQHSINTVPNVTLANVHSLKKEEYELVLHSLLREAEQLDQSKDPCGPNFIPDTKGKTYQIIIQMSQAKDFNNWMKLAKCFKIWDLDARGYHKGLWRLWLKDNQVLVIGHPYSPYSTKYMAPGVVPYSFTTPPPPP